MCEESLFNKDLPKELTEFLENSELKGILEEHEKASKECDSVGFNIFTIISDYYFRENFHGDILMAFLNPEGKHGEGDKFLKIFIDMLGVDANNYGLSTTVDREVGLTGENKGRIDFVIKNEKNHHCIIVENKLYDAVDMPNQLSRYFDEMEGMYYKVDKIAYLPLSVGKRPEGITKEVDDLLKVVPAVNVSDSKCSLIDNWIDPCIEAASSLDCISILRQYKRLLIFLKPEIAKYKSSMELYDFLCCKDNLNNVLTLRKMLDDLGISLRYRLDSKLKNLGIVSKKQTEYGLVIGVSNNIQIYVYCGQENLGYNMRIVRGGDSDPINIAWLSQKIQKELKDRIQKYSYGQYIHYDLDKEEELIRMIYDIYNFKTI